MSCVKIGLLCSKGSKCRWMFVGMIPSELQNILLSNLVWWCTFVCYLQGQGHSKTVSGCLSGSYLLNSRSFWYQTWYGNAASCARVSCRKAGLLSLILRWQWGLIWLKYDYFCAIFWAAGPCETKLSLVVQHHEPKCHAEKQWFTIFKVKVTARAHVIRIWLFLLYYLNCGFLGNQTWSDDTSS